MFLLFLGKKKHPWQMEVPRLEVGSELQLQAYTTATAMQGPSCDLCHNSWQCQVLNPLNEARDRTCNLMRFLVGFISASPQRELLKALLINAFCG